MKRRDFGKLAAGAGLALGFGALDSTIAYAETPGGGMTALVQPEPPILNLALNQQQPTGVVAGKIYESLLNYAFDLSPMPQLAKSWEISEDGLTYTFHLVQNAKWHDGEPFTSADVVFSCSVMLPEVHPRARANFARCESITAPDDYTVVFKLKEPFGPFLLSFETSSAPMVPKHIFEGTDFRNAPADDTPIGTGPFKYNEWVRGSHIHLVAFEDYYLDGKPGLTEIYYRIIPDAASRSVALETGEVQMSQWADLESFDVARLASLPNLELTTKGYEFFSPMSWFELNLRNAPMNDIKVRKAMMHLIDRDFIVDRIMFGLAKKATGPIASTTKFFEPELPTYEFEVDKANALLDEAGLTPDANGTRASIKFLVAPYGELYARLAEFFRQSMAAAGIEVTLETTDVAGWSQKISNWDYDVSTNTLYQFGDPALGVARSYISTNIRKGVMFSNTQGYANPIVDELFAKAAIQTSEEERQKLYSEVQRILVDELPVLWTVERHYPTLYDNRIKDLIVTATGVNSNFANAHYS